MPNVNFDQLASTTLNKHVKTIEHNAFNRKPFGWKLKNNVTKHSGGLKIVKPVNFSTGGAVNSFERYDTLGSTLWTGPTAAEYPWKQVETVVMLDNQSILQNGTPEGVINLLKANIDIAEEGLLEGLNTMWFGDGTGNSGKNMLGLGALIGDDTSAITTVGGIACTGANSEAQWRSKVIASGTAGTFSAAGTGSGNYAGVKGHQILQNAFSSTNRGAGNQVTALYSNQNLYDSYFNSLEPTVRRTEVESANAGFENVTFKGKPWFYEEAVPNLVVYGVNHDKLGLDVMSNRWFTTTPFFQPDFKDARYAHILCMGNLTTTSRRTHFMVTFAAA